MAGRASILIPLALIGALVMIFITTNPFDYLSEGIPPGEELKVETVRLDDSGIHVAIRAAGSLPVIIAQVQVDGAYRSFSQDPVGPLGYLKSVQIDIPYPWVTGDAHHLLFLTSTGTTFEHTIELAIKTSRARTMDYFGLAMIGFLVGIVPVLIGFAFYPALMSYGQSGREFAMAVTVGLLVFLLIDTLSEGLEIAGRAIGGLKAELLVWLSAIFVTLALLAIGRRTGKPPEGSQLATFIAIGIGVHNFGEGLVIGSSLAVGEVALATFLVLGFALHNVTEGIAISAPLRSGQFNYSKLLVLALIAGGPAILGTLTGSAAIAPIWTALAFGIGAGAITQVIIEVASSYFRQQRSGDMAWYSTASFAGFGFGIAVMYATAFAVRG